MFFARYGTAVIRLKKINGTKRSPWISGVNMSEIPDYVASANSAQRAALARVA